MALKIGKNNVSVWSRGMIFGIFLVMALNTSTCQMRSYYNSIEEQNEKDLMFLTPTKNGSQQAVTPFALMTEPRCVAAAPFVLQNALERLPSSVKVIFLHSQENSACVRQWLNRKHLELAYAAGRLVVSEDSRITTSKGKIYSPTNWNNQLYRNATFWQGLKVYGDVVLTIQSDTLICSTDVPPWNATYLGGISWLDQPLRASNQTNSYHLNGGFSIRQLDWMIHCLQNMKNEGIEDNIMNSCIGGREKVTVLEAMAFSSDNGNTKCFDWKGQRLCPWGVHKPWVKTKFPEGDEYLELVTYCPEIEALKFFLKK